MKKFHQEWSLSFSWLFSDFTSKLILNGFLIWLEKSISKLLLPLGRNNFLTGGGPKYFLRRKIWLRRLVHGFCIWLFRSIQIACNSTQCCWRSSITNCNGGGRGYCYMIGRGPICCLLSHVTGLLFCLYAKIFLPSIFILTDCWNSMSLIVLDLELTEKNIIKELGPFIHGFLQGFSFFPP